MPAAARCLAGVALAAFSCTGAPAWAHAPAQPAASPPAAAASSAPKPAATPSDDAQGGAAAYARVVKDAERQAGLFVLYRKEGRIGLEIATDQFDRDFVEHVVPANGVGGFGFEPGQMFAQAARIVRFHRAGARVAMIWPQTRFLATPGTPLATAVDASTADSVQALLAVVAEDKASGKVLVDLTPLLGDTLDLGDALSERLKSDGNPQGAYRLDPARTFLGPSKAFPKNVVIEADETFASAKPDALDTVADARFVQVRVKYNISEILATPGYVPRLYDDRVGYFEDPHVQFADDSRRDNYLWYILRWDVQASDPSKRLSPAKKPILFTLDGSIPVEYRAPVREAILEWNKAFERIGITHAVAVQDQPSDPAYDPDDIRYNVVRWVTNAVNDFGAEAQFVWDPRTGEIFRGGVLLDSSLVRSAKFVDRLDVEPSRALDEIVPPPAAAGPQPWRSEPSYEQGMLGEFAFGATALALEGDGMRLDGFSRDLLKAVTMHEVGHDFGLSHNFIAHNAFTARQLQSREFTARNGVTSSVMEYAPINVWPKGVSRGSYFQLTLGPYDYHAIHWGYARVAGAKTTRDETPTLARWAGAAVDPRFAFAGDEDAFYNGHAVDPRVAPFMLTDHPMVWCDTQVGLARTLIAKLDARYPQPQAPWSDERVAFLSLMRRYNLCATSMAHYIGGEYLSRARPGDPHAPPPLTAVPRALEVQAYGLLDRYLLAESAWHFSPALLNRLVYTEYMPFADFGYDPPARHDLSVAQLAASAQNAVLGYMFSPIVLQRIADLPDKSPSGHTMSLADLFAWTQHSVFGDLDAPAAASQVHRNLQRRYARLLGRMATTPFPGTPYDAQALARHDLASLSATLAHALRRPRIDVQTRAHLEALAADVTRALETRAVIPG